MKNNLQKADNFFQTQQLQDICQKMWRPDREQGHKRNECLSKIRTEQRNRIIFLHLFIMEKLKAFPILKVFLGDAPEALSQIRALDKIRNQMDGKSRHKSLGPGGVSKQLNDETVMWNCLHETVSISQNCRLASETPCERGVWSESLTPPSGSLVKLDQKESVGEKKHIGYWESSAELWQREVRPYKSFGWRPQIEQVSTYTRNSLLMRLAQIYKGKKFPCQRLFEKPSSHWMGGEFCMPGNPLKNIGNNR